MASEFFSDSDWEGDKYDRKSVSGFLVLLNGAAICWGSRKQSLTSLLSSESEYVAVSEICKEILFIKNILEFINQIKIDLPILVN